MPLVSKAAARKEIQETFPRLPNISFLDDFAKVGSFLSDASAVATALLPLERALQQKLELRHWGPYLKSFFRTPSNGASPQRIAAASTYFAARAQGTVTKDETYSHLLTEALIEDEQAHGYATVVEDTYGYLGPFDPRNRRRVQTYTRPFTGEEFRAKIRQRRHWKDPTVSARHGEFTHRLQWYAVAHANLQLAKPVASVFAAVGAVARRKKKFLQRSRERLQDQADRAGTSLDEYLRALGFDSVENLVNSPAGVIQGFVQWGLWDLLCDRTDGVAVDPSVIPFVTVNQVSDFRSAEVFNDWLTGRNTVGLPSRVSLPLLTSFLEARRAKRENSPINNANAYAAPKVYGRPWSKLSKTEQADLRDLVEGTGYFTPYG